MKNLFIGDGTKKNAGISTSVDKTVNKISTLKNKEISGKMWSVCEKERSYP